MTGPEGTVSRGSVSRPGQHPACRHQGQRPWALPDRTHGAGSFPPAWPLGGAPALAAAGLHDATCPPRACRQARHAGTRAAHAPPRTSPPGSPRPCTQVQHARRPPANLPAIHDTNDRTATPTRADGGREKAHSQAPAQLSPDHAAPQCRPRCLPAGTVPSSTGIKMLLEVRSKAAPSARLSRMLRSRRRIPGPAALL